MAEKIIMPKAGIAMEEGVIIEWLKNEGDVIEKGDLIAVIETDKVTMELESDYDGTLLKILYPASSTVPVVEVIAWIGEKGEDVPDSPEVKLSQGNNITEPSIEKKDSGLVVNTGGSAAAQPQPDVNSINGKVMATPAARKFAKKKNIPLEEISPSGKFGEVRERDVLAMTGNPVTPLAARIADAENIDINSISGSGHDGKIFKGDLNTAQMHIQMGSSINFEDKFVKLTGIQKITGKRMLRSHTEVPAVTEDIKADVTELLSIRKSLNNSLETPITINDFILSATAKALRKNPGMNSILDGNGLLYKGHINLGMAVASPKGLLVPVIRDADLYSITALSAKAKELSEKCRNGKLQQEEMEGGTFTVSNIGMFGITSFTPIINQPEAGILGVCSIEDQLKMIEGEIVNRNIMGLSLTFDHRIVDGAEAAIFFKTIRDLLEAPLTILA